MFLFNAKKDSRTNRKTLGDKGEKQAARYLKKEGYKIREKNHREKTGEIDIIASDGKTICFVEVKTRRGNQYGGGLAAVGAAKQRKIGKTAAIYLMKNGMEISLTPIRFDVLAINIAEDGAPAYELIKGAFDFKI